MTVTKIAEMLNAPAVLEQCAEECAELSKACLKTSRKLRGENPTPKSKEEILSNLNEEVTDVLLCIDTIIETGMVSRDIIESTKKYKLSRWEKRINESKSNSEKEKNYGI